MVSYDEHIKAIEDFNSSGSRGYKSWLGSPDTVMALSSITEVLSAELTYLENVDYHIHELGPQGGRWTNQVLSTFKKKGFPKTVDYSLIGCKAELDLVRNDVIKPCCLGYQYGDTARVRSGQPHRMISELCFRPYKYNITMLSSLGSSLPLMLGECSLLLCMDNLQFLTDKQVSDLFIWINYHLRDGGLLMTSIQTERSSILARELLHEYERSESVSIKSVDGRTTYVAARKRASQ